MNSAIHWMREKITKDHISEAIAWLVILAIAMPICVASAYVFLRADDFVEGILKIRGNGSFFQLMIYAFNFAKESWLNWAGAYFSKVMEALLHPINAGNELMQLKLVMSGNTLLFMFSFGLFMYALAKSNIEKHHLRMWFVIGGYIGVLGFQAWYEALYWYTGAVVYSLPLSMFFLAFAILMLEKRESIVRDIITGIFLFCGAGGHLPVVGAGCWILIIIIINQYFHEQKFKRKYLVLLFITVTGALMNVLAPGNYVRQDAQEGGVYLFRSMVWSFDFMIRNCKWLFLETPFILLVLVVFLIGVAEGKREKVNAAYVKVMVILSALTPWIVGYPVCLGYAANVGMKNRIQFVMVCVIVIGSLNSALLAGKVIATKLSASLIGEIVIAATMLAIIMPSSKPAWTLDQMVPYKTLVELANGSIQHYYREVNRIYEAIRNDENEDVFVTEIPKQLDIFEVIVFPDDPTHFLNTTLASYFNKKSVQGVSEVVYYSADTTYIRISPDTFNTDLSYVTIVNDCEGDIQMLQVLEPLQKNLVIEVPAGKSGKVGIYAYADEKGQTCVLQKEIEY